MKLCATYCQRNLQATLFQCVLCGDKAEGLVDQPFILTQTAERATFDRPTPVCGKGSCNIEAKQNLQAVVHQNGNITWHRHRKHLGALVCQMWQSWSGQNVQSLHGYSLLLARMTGLNTRRLVILQSQWQTSLVSLCDIVVRYLLEDQTMQHRGTYPSGHP